jgi:hypothetical protein
MLLGPYVSWEKPGLDLQEVWLSQQAVDINAQRMSCQLGV